MGRQAQPDYSQILGPRGEDFGDGGDIDSGALIFQVLGSVLHSLPLPEHRRSHSLFIIRYFL